MHAIIISNTSCLILLGKVHELDLLKRLFGKISTTQTVAKAFGGQLPEWIIIQKL